MDDQHLFEEKTVAQALSDLSPQIDEAQAAGDHDRLGELIAKRDALLAHLASIQDFTAHVLCDI